MPELEIKDKIESETPLGIYKVKFKEYQNVSYLNQSSIKHYSKSPAHYYSNKKNPKEATAAMVEGRVWHTGILEPETFFNEYAIQPKINKSTIIGKKALAEWLEEHHGKEPVTKELTDNIYQAHEQIHANPSLSPFLKGGHAELTFLTKDPFIDFYKKGMLDYWHPDTNIIIDLKTTRNCDIDSFSRDIQNMLYHVQAAWYCDQVKEATGRKVEAYAILALEKTAPFSCRLFVLPEKVIEQGRILYNRYLGIHKTCLENNKWPTFENLVVDFDPKPWFYNYELPDYPQFEAQK